MTRMATASVFRTRADADALDPGLRKGLELSAGGGRFETRGIYRSSTIVRSRLGRDGCGPYRPVEFHVILSTALRIKMPKNCSGFVPFR